MGILARDKLQKALRKKGFAENEGTRHVIYRLLVNGVDGGIHTIISRGTNYKTLGPPLFARIRSQLQLETDQELLQFADCPLTAADYLNLLRSRGTLGS